jgi:hypothetical protein
MSVENPPVSTSDPFFPLDSPGRHSKISPKMRVPESMAESAQKPRWQIVDDHQNASGVVQFDGSTIDDSGKGFQLLKIGTEQWDVFLLAVLSSSGKLVFLTGTQVQPVDDAAGCVILQRSINMSFAEMRTNGIHVWSLSQTCTNL